MELSALKIESSNNSVLLSWYADNRALRLKFSGDVINLPAAADAAFASCLMPAMLLGQTLTVDPTFALSRELPKNLNKFQQIFSGWFDDLQSVNLDIAEPSLHDSLVKPDGNAVFYSGGVDASYSFFELQDDIDYLIFCLGLDIQLQEKERCDKALESARKFAEHYGKRLIVIETNFREAFPELSAKRCQIVLLISYSLALGLRCLFVPASHDALELEPFITHPMTDPLLTNGVTEVVHHGMVSRVKKTIAIARSEQALAFLRVCNASDQFNCGKCEKCLRTMATLAAIGVSSPALPALADMRQLWAAEIWTPGKYHMWHDIYHCAKQNGAMRLAQAVNKLCRRYEWKQLLNLFRAQSLKLLRDLTQR